MKSKKKFDPKIFKQFFIDHTEKLVVGLVVALFVFFAYNSFTLKYYDKKPEDLKNLTATAQAKILSGPATPNKAKVTCSFPPYDKDIEEFKSPLDPQAYPMPPRMNWKPFDPLRLRETPEVFPVEQLRAIAGRGAILKSDDPTNSESGGKRWVVVTGLVPVRKQFEEFSAKFDGAVLETPDDAPSYMGFFYQRAEVIPGDKSPPKWSNITIVSPKTPDLVAAVWGGRMAPEIESPKFFEEKLTSPLPQLVNGAWGPEGVSPPQIPLVLRPANASGTPGFMTDRPRRLRYPRPRPVDPSGGSGMGGASTAGESILSVAPDPAKAAAEKAAKEEEADPDYKLLRFFDFDVKPNKQYLYRVFLVLKNPNFQLNANVLTDPGQAAQPYLGVLGAAPTRDAAGKLDWPSNPKYWSTACSSDRMPDDMRLLAGKVAPAKPPQEISAEVRILRWDEVTGQFGGFSKDGLIRGTLLNFPQAPVKSPGVPRAVAHDILANSILLDLQGGDSLTANRDKPIVSPGMILVMDQTGNLVMHDEVTESKEWEDATREPETQRRGPDAPGQHRRHVESSGVSGNDLDDRGVRGSHGR